MSCRGYTSPFYLLPIDTRTHSYPRRSVHERYTHYTHGRHDLRHDLFRRMILRERNSPLSLSLGIHHPIVFVSESSSGPAWLSPASCHSCTMYSCHNPCHDSLPFCIHPCTQCRFIDTPLYVSQNKFDSNQAGSIFGVSWWPLPLNKAKHAASQVAYKQYVKEKTRTHY